MNSGIYMSEFPSVNGLFFFCYSSVIVPLLREFALSKSMLVVTVDKIRHYRVPLGIWKADVSAHG
jgi:hypothetical protein